MAHYAQINSDNIVTNVIVIPDTVTDGQDFCANVLGLGGKWIQTSYNTFGNVHYSSPGSPQTPSGKSGVRGNFASIGYVYDEANDVFYPQQPYPSWTIGLSSNWVWTAPVPYPTDDKHYMWNETVLNWVALSGSSGINIS